MEVADVDALALVGGGLLVEAVPAAATHAAHKLFLSSFLPKSLEKVTSSWSPGTPIAHIYAMGFSASTREVVSAAESALSRQVLARYSCALHYRCTYLIG